MNQQITRVYYTIWVWIIVEGRWPIPAYTYIIWTHMAFMPHLFIFIYDTTWNHIQWMYMYECQDRVDDFFDILQQKPYCIIRKLEVNIYITKGRCTMNANETTLHKRPNYTKICKGSAEPSVSPTIAVNYRLNKNEGKNQ